MKRILYLLITLMATPAFADFEAAADYSKNRGGACVVEDVRGISGAWQRRSICHNDTDMQQAWHTASSNKDSWGEAIYKLIEEGKLPALDEPLANVLPSFRAPGYEDILTAHAIWMTSGLYNDLDDIGAWCERRRSCVPDIYEHVAGNSGGFPSTHPGRRMKPNAGNVFRYGPPNYFAICQAIKNVTGQDPGDYVRENVFDPIGVQINGWWEDAAGNSKCPRGLVIRPGEWAEYGRHLLTGLDPNVEAFIRTPSPQNPGRGAIWLNSQGGFTANGGAPGGSECGFLYHNGHCDMMASRGAGPNAMYMIPNYPNQGESTVLVRQCAWEDGLTPCPGAWVDHDFLSAYFSPGQSGSVSPCPR